MRKQTLTSLVSLVLSAATASANPWANYDWSTGQWATPNAGAAQQQSDLSAINSYRTQVVGQGPVARPPVKAADLIEPVDQSTSESTAQQVSFAPGVSSFGVAMPQANCPTCQPGPSAYAQAPQIYGPPMTSQPPVVQTPAPAVESYGGPIYGEAAPITQGPIMQGPPSASFDPYGGAIGHGYGYGAAPGGNYTVGFYSEALFFERENYLDDLRNFTDGPADSGFSFADLYGTQDATGFRLGLEFLSCDACSPWQRGFGFDYFDPGSFGSVTGGTLATGLAFDAGTKGTDPSTLAGCFVLSQNTFFASMARVASVNTLTNNEQDEFEGLGPDPSTVAFDPGRTTGSETFALPTWEAGYDSEVWSVGAHYIVARRGPKRFKLGVGWKQYQVNENSFAAIRGPFHATDASFFTPAFPQAPAALNNGLEHGSFLDTTRNDGSDPGLLYLGPPGAEDGFDAQNNGTAGLTDGIGPDTLELLSGQSANNTLNGLNIFVVSQLFGGTRFDVNGRLDLGVYHNTAEATVFERYTELTGNGSVYGRSFSEQRDVVSFVAGASIDAGYWVTEWLRLYGGYEVMFINGVALSPEQESGITGTQFRLQHDGDLMMRGAKAGFEILY